MISMLRFLIVGELGVVASTMSRQTSLSDGLNSAATGSCDGNWPSMMAPVSEW